MDNEFDEEISPEVQERMIKLLDQYLYESIKEESGYVTKDDLKVEIIRYVSEMTTDAEIKENIKKELLKLLDEEYSAR